jgi:hypothetical protein
MNEAAGHEGIVMLAFVNPSTSFDGVRRAVRFWGHDGAFEIAFLVTRDALGSLRPGMPDDEANCLAVFDANRPTIHAAALRAYGIGKKSGLVIDIGEI